MLLEKVQTFDNHVTKVGLYRTNTYFFVHAGSMADMLKCDKTGPALQ